MSEWKQRMTMKRIGNYKAEFEVQLKEEARLNALIA